MAAFNTFVQSPLHAGPAIAPGKRRMSIHPRISAAVAIPASRTKRPISIAAPLARNTAPVTLATRNRIDGSAGHGVARATT